MYVLYCIKIPKCHHGSLRFNWSHDTITLSYFNILVFIRVKSCNYIWTILHQCVLFSTYLLDFARNFVKHEIMFLFDNHLNSIHWESFKNMFRHRWVCWQDLPERRSLSGSGQCLPVQLCCWVWRNILSDKWVVIC